MNAKQRDYLEDQAQKVYNKQIEEIENEIPDFPNLNNYLVAAVFDGSFKLVDTKELRDKIKKRVKKLGKSEVLVSEQDGYYRKKRKEEPQYQITLEVDDIFILPEAYKKEVEEYWKIKNELEARKKILQDQLQTIIMKIQIGSDKQLDRLIEEVDNLCDLSLMNSMLLLAPKQISNH